ncbi:NlpC/P60 family protein [Catenulispora subtropica]|uniref:NlpC/P60 domain-containing protein n=1 Tax=Catenulispora subtropica TaxID=450798 RepID=A0ABN2QY18_9ACTN
MNRIRGLTRWLAVGGLLAAGLTPAAAQAHTPAPQPAMSCHPFVILSAYGTNESSDSQHRWGDVGVNNNYIWGLKKALSQHGYGGANLDGDSNVLPDATVDIRNVDYPAAPDLWPPTFTGYMDSMNRGRDEIVREVRWYSDNCGGTTTVILVGYSQGAEAVKNALSEPGLQSVESEVGAIVDIADPSRDNGQAGMAQDGQMRTLDANLRPASASVADGGLFERRPVPGVFAGFIGGGRYFDVCRTDDHVCNRPGAVGSDWLKQFGDSLPQHTQYGTANDENAPASEITSAAVNTAVQHHVSQTGTGGVGALTCDQKGETDPLGAAAIQAACGVIARPTWYTWGGGHSVSPPRATYGSVDKSDPVRSANDPQHLGFDCSGFIRYVYYVAAGYDIIGDTTADGNFKAPWNVRITPAQGIGALRPGDVLFFGSATYVHHTALYLGQGVIAEARQSGEYIRVSNLSDHADYAGAIRVSGAGGGGGPNSTWGTGVRTHTSPSVSAPVYTTLPGPTGIRIDCQEHAESVTAEGYTNDVWSHLPDLGGSWVSNIYVKGPGWLPNIPACDGTQPSGGSQSTWGTDVRVHSLASVSAPVVATISTPTAVTVQCQEHAESVTAEGVTNDAWSYIPDYGGYVSNIYMKGDAWLAGVPTCDGGVAGGGGNHMTWGTDVNLHTAPSSTSDQAGRLAGPTAVRIDCQVHGQSVTAEGYTNDGWSHLPDYNGWISNIYVKGEPWLTDVPACDGGQTGGQNNDGNQRQIWATNVNVRADTTTAAAVVTTIAAPTVVTIKCQWHGSPVTDQGYTNDGWSYLPDYNGWVSNIYIKGPAWLDGINECTAPPHSS